MHFWKKYWFSLLMSIFILCAITYFIVVFISPRYDIQRRGFVPCTEQLADEVEICGQNNILCILAAIGNDNLCNIKVIVKGFSNWLVGEQNTPWSNYIYTPEVPQYTSDNEEEREDFYRAEPELIQDMKNLKKLNKEQQLDE